MQTVYACVCMCASRNKWTTCGHHYSTIQAWLPWSARMTKDKDKNIYSIHSIVITYMYSKIYIFKDIMG